MSRSHPSLSDEYGRMLQGEGATYPGKDNAAASRDFLKRHPNAGSTLIIGPGLHAVSETGELPGDLLGEFMRSGPVIIADFCKAVLSNARDAARELGVDIINTRDFDASAGWSAAFHDWWLNLKDASSDSALQKLLALTPEKLVEKIAGHLHSLRASISSGNDAEAPSSSSGITSIQDCVRILAHSVFDGMLAVDEHDVRSEIARLDASQQVDALRTFHNQISFLNTHLSTMLVLTLLQAHPRATLLATFARNTRYASGATLLRMNIEEMKKKLHVAGIDMVIQGDLPQVHHSYDPFPHSHEMSCVEFSTKKSADGDVA